MIYIGCDPGKNGGLAILNGEEVQTFRYGRDTYHCILSDLRGEKAVCCLEHVSAMPGQGVTSMFHFGEGFGWLQGMLEEDAVPVPQWISVKDRLPDVNRTGSGYEEITVIATDGERVRPMIYERACVRDKTKCRWKWIWDRIYKGKPIVAWMPLPEPPKGGFEQ